MLELHGPPISRITWLQLLILVVVMLLAWGTGTDPVTRLSLVAGTVIAVVPQAYFGYRVFRFVGARSSRQVAQSFYRGEAAKFALTAMGFALVFAVIKPINGLAVFAAFGGMTVLHWVGSWWFTRARNSGRENS